MPMGATPFPFGDCRVCTDKATGVHYGVATCEGCKGFFKRSIPKAERYQCFFGGRCIVNPQNRNRCKACRFQRCVSVGMSIDAVKMGRIPKVNKERALAAHRHDDNASSSSDERPFALPTSSSSSSSVLPSSFLSQMSHHNLPMMEAQHPRSSLPSSQSKQFSSGPIPNSVAPFDHSDNFLCANTHDNNSSEAFVSGDHASHAWASEDTPPQQVPRPCPPQAWQKPPGAPQGSSEQGASPCSSVAYSPLGVSPYSPTVIKELINQVIESGQGQELQQTLIRQFFKDEIPLNLKRKLSPEEDSYEPPVKQEVIPFKQEVSQATDLQDDLFLFDLINMPFKEPPVPQQQQHPSSPLQEEGFLQQLQLDLHDLDQYLGPSSNDVDARYLQRHSRLSLDTDKAKLLTTKLLTAATSFIETLSRNRLLMREEVSGAREPHPMNTITHARKHQVLFMWNQLMDSIPVCNFDVLGLCRGIPMFNDLKPKDQAVLMEEAYFDIWLTMNAGLFQKGDSYMRLPCDARYSRLWMHYFLPEKVVDEMFYYTEKINICHLTQGEIITICIIQLTNPEHRGITDPGQVSQLHQVYLGLLWRQLQLSHQTDYSQVFNFIMQLLPMLGPLNKMQAEIVAKFQVDSPPDGVLRYTNEDGDFVNKEFD